MALSDNLILWIKGLGFKVYMRYPEDDYMIYTSADGRHLGYLQHTALEGIATSTVHRPCKECGTGFAMFRHIEEKYLSRDDLEAAFCRYPDWARQHHKAVVKYKDIDAYRAANKFNAGYLER